MQHKIDSCAQSARKQNEMPATACTPSHSQVVFTPFISNISNLAWALAD